MGDLVTLQHVIYPEPGLCTEAAMFYHSNGPSSFRRRDRGSEP